MPLSLRDADELIGRAHAKAAELGIRVVAVAPGYVRTPMVAELERTGKADLNLVRRRIPLGRAHE